MQEKESFLEHIHAFAERLNELIIIHGETVKSLCEKTGISDSSMYGYLNGQHIPDTEFAIKIADCFLCPLDYLFGFCEDFKPKQRNIVATVSERVKSAIDRSGKTRYRIARETGFDQSRLHGWYHGKTTPALYFLVALVEPLNTTLEFLAGRE